MCTIVILQRVVPGHPVVVAANRDEFYARPASGPHVLADTPRAIGGLDHERAGSWMGVTETGLFVGLTNQRTYRAADPSKRSRGDVVVEALRRGDAGAVTAYLDTLDAREFNPFNLAYGDARGLRVAYARDDIATIETHAVPDGIHVLPNDVLDSGEFPKVDRVRALAVDAIDSAGDDPRWESLARGLRAALSDHAIPGLDTVDDPPPGTPFSRELVRQLHAVCIHTSAYGTRSATIAALSDRCVDRYLYAPGPPCVTPFEDATGLLG